MRVSLIAVLAIFVSLFQASSSVHAQSSSSGIQLTARSSEDQAWAEILGKYAAEGRRTIERYFGAPFAETIVIEIVPGRAEFDAFMKERWGVEKTESWMVALGVADRLVMLSPRAWRTQATEHDSSDKQHVRRILLHELVHVYHGQRNPTRDFTGMDELGWFVEGLATCVSGQLAQEHRGDAAKAIAANHPPNKLENAWTGRYRYGVCGSMVEYIEKRFGRSMIRKLLPVRAQAEALKTLNLSEEEFLKDWTAYARKGRI